MQRLQVLSNELFQRLRQSSGPQLAEIRRIACERAFVESEIENAAAREILEKFLAGLPPTQDERERLETVVEELDDEYFSKHETAERFQLPPDEYLSAFRKARAASAPLIATEADPFEATCESIYEAAMATPDAHSFITRLTNLL